MAETAAVEPKTKFDKIPIHFQLDEKLIDAASIKPPSFASFADCIGEAHKMTQPVAFSARLLRQRMSKQVLYHVNGAALSITPEQALRLPVNDFYKIVNALDGGEGKPGKIIRDGDGINKALTYELGTPIPAGKDKVMIQELEFYAPTYGDIEDVLAADGPAAQTSVLIKQVARPLGDGVTLLRLTDAHFSYITVADGTEISNLVLPRFLGVVNESPRT